MVRSLVQYLVQSGYTCNVYYFDALLDLKFPCEAKQIKFLDLIHFSEYDIIHSHLFRPDLYCSYHVKAIIASKARWITTIHTAIYDDLNYTYGKLIASFIITLWKVAWKRADQAVVLTESAKEYYQETKFRSLCVIANGIDLPSKQEQIPEADLELINDLKKSHQLLGTVCVVERRKGLEQLLELLVINKEYAVVIVGDGAERARLEAYATELNVAERFKVLGYRPDGYRYISEFDLFLLPSKSEGMPIALLEAMASKIAIVCSDIPTISGQFEEGAFAYFTLDDVFSLQSACEYATLNADQLKSKAYYLYTNHYTTAQMGLNYTGLYRSLTNMS